MSKSRQILADVLSGRADANLTFADLCHILERMGFTRRTGKGSHTIFHMAKVDEIVTFNRWATPQKPTK